MPSDFARAAGTVRPAGLGASSAPRTARGYAAQLSRPLPIEQVEDIESHIKQLWRDRLFEPRMKAGDARGFLEFFRIIGFTYKYKPYGVKIASPFGYSIFDLKPGRGFSFQVHSKPKLEAFHVLAVKPSGFVFVCSRDEWENVGLASVERWACNRESTIDSPYAWFPSAGDTIVIAGSSVVHTAVGCVLEEYANCSTDAVVRLYDQNERKSHYLPRTHPSIPELLAAGHAGPPVNKVFRSGDSWAESPLAEDEPIVDVDQRLQGRRLKLRRTQSFTLAASPGAITTLVCVKGSVECLLCGVSAPMAAGDILTIPPGWDATLRAGRRTALAVHSVPPAEVFQDWD